MRKKYHALGESKNLDSSSIVLSRVLTFMGAVIKYGIRIACFKYPGYNRFVSLTLLEPDFEFCIEFIT